MFHSPIDLAAVLAHVLFGLVPDEDGAGAVDAGSGVAAMGVVVAPPVVPGLGAGRRFVDSWYGSSWGEEQSSCFDPTVKQQVGETRAGRMRKVECRLDKVSKRVHHSDGINDWQRSQSQTREGCRRRRENWVRSVH